LAAVFICVNDNCWLFRARAVQNFEGTDEVKSLKYGFRLCVLIFLGMASVASASSWSCQAARNTREVVVFYPKAPARLPCKVYYAKPEENVLPRALWEATNTHNYCENRAKELVEKLSSMGWRCLRSDPE
jgi:hypothetical protein